MSDSAIKRLPTPIAIIGMGISGLAAKSLLLKIGYNESELFTFDAKSENAEFNDPIVLMQKSPKTLVVSPGVPLASTWIQEAIKAGIHLTSELEIAFDFLRNCQVVAVTGSVGKSTVTEMIGAAIRAIDPGVFVGGNLGTPLATVAESILSGRQTCKYVVLELSSYQLENFKNLKASCGVITHLSPNHLERYRDLQHYYNTKLQLLEMTDGPVFVNRNGGDLWAQLEPRLVAKTRWVDRNSAVLNKSTPNKILGSHNLDNLALATSVVEHLNLSDAAYIALKNFEGLEHRIENLGTHQGITFINDSKATAMDSVQVAVQSVLESSFLKGHCYLLLGGRDKNLPWEVLKNLPPKIVPCYFGEFGRQAKEKVGKEGSVDTTLKACLSNLKPKLKSGDVVLLSPGGSSFDEFKSFRDRGNFFKSWLKTEFQNTK